MVPEGNANGIWLMTVGNQAEVEDIFGELEIVEAGLFIPA
jgi:hypothetical protein